MWLVTVYIDPGQFGTYSLWLSIVTVSAGVFISWPNAGFLRYARVEWGNTGVVNNTLSARLILFLISAIACITLFKLFDKRIIDLLEIDHSPFVYVSTAVILFSIPQLIVYLCQSMDSYKPLGYVSAFNKFAMFLAVLFVAFTKTSQSWKVLVFFFIGSSFLVSIISFNSIPKKFFTKITVPGKEIKLICKYSWAIPLGSIGTFTIQWVDSWFLRAYKTLSVVGVYSWAYQITSVANLAFIPLGALFAPKIIDAWAEKNHTLIKTYVSLALKCSLLFSLSMALFLISVKPLLNIFFGELYQSSYIPILLLFSIVPIQFVSYMLVPVINANEKIISKNVFISIVVMIVNLFGDLLLIEKNGMTGAAFSTLLSFFLGVILKLVLLRRYMSFIDQPLIIKFISAFFPMVMSCVVLMFTGKVISMFILIVALFLYIILLKKFKLFKRGDTVLIDNLDVPKNIKKLIVNVLNFAG